MPLSTSFPLCSVVMPLFNAEDYLVASVKSVQAQSFSDWELLLVDDASTDASAQLAKQLAASDSRIRVFSLAHNSGAARARNLALEEARGRFIAFLDSDDLWHPAKLERQLGWMQAQQLPFTFTAYEKINEQGEHLGWMGVPTRVSYSQLLKCCVIGCLTAVYDRQRLGQVLMPDLRTRQDFALWLQLLKKTPAAYGLNQPLARYRVRSTSLSANKLQAARQTWHLYRQVEKLDWLPSSYYFTHYALRGLLRLKAPRLAEKLGVLQPVSHSADATQ